MLGSELGGHDHVEGVASATYALGIEVQVDDPGLFHGKLRTRYPTSAVKTHPVPPTT